MENIPAIVAARAEKANEELLPKKSKLLYDKEYECFETWTSRNSVIDISKTVLMGFFQELPQHIVDEVLNAEDHIISIQKSKYRRISSFRSLFETDVERIYPKKSKILTREDTLKFIKETSSHTYLLEKVVLVMAVFGGLRRDVLVKLLIDDIDDKGSVVIVRIYDIKTRVPKYFRIVEENEMHALQLYRQYISVRPKEIKERRFFLTYRNGRCTAQPVGKNTFGSIPSRIQNIWAMQMLKCTQVIAYVVRQQPFS
ncbi:hypothetical protein NQ315_008905 [Exocentrus adspersus]|uniref:Tyr recombinase domain-containing protein n=1 Tax=Exocentrus adspersus TaxID=1586481 RepID=A0AAV8V772_9CUCU|nr:hypothetical protein NQ315_008905 [Exocentrus adspersus]